MVKNSTGSLWKGLYSDPLQRVERLKPPALGACVIRVLLTESVGIPARLKHFNLIGQAGRDALELAFQPKIDFFSWFLRIGHSVQDATFSRYFSRIAIAQMSAELASAISERLVAAIDYWQTRIAKLIEEGPDSGLFGVERLRLFIEALARLAVRQDPQAAFGSFHLAMKLGQNPSLRHWWLFEPIGNLAKFSGEAVPPSERKGLVLPALEFPLSSEAGLTEKFPRSWPNPLLLLFDSLFETPPDRSIDGTRWRKRILELIGASSAESAGRAEAVLRLTYLAHHKALTDDETVDFAEALWSKKDGQDPPLPAGTGLLSFGFAELPSPAEIDAAKSVLSRLFDVETHRIMTPAAPNGSINLFEVREYLVSIAAVARRPLRPTAEQAVRIFDELVSWRPYAFRDRYPAELLGPQLLGSQNEGIGLLIGEALTLTIVPSIPLAELTASRARSLLQMISEAHAHTAVAALPYFAAADGETEAAISERVRRAVASSHFDEVASGASAVEIWAELDRTRQQERLSKQLIGQIISAIEARREIGLHALLHCAQKLLELGRLTSADVAVLCQALADLLASTTYDNVDAESRAAVSVSFIRANCVRLAHALQTHGSSENILAMWLDAAEKDALPEVRFALQSTGSVSTGSAEA